MKEFADLRVAAFTGPRPEKLPPDTHRESIEEALHRAICTSAEEGYTVFISGGCRGIDLWAARQVLALRREYALKLACFIPYRNQADRWPAADREMYEEVVRQASLVKVLSEHFYRRVYHDRNRAMLEQSNRLIAVCGPQTGGGTGHTVGLARVMGPDIILIDPENPTGFPGAPE